MTTKPVIVNNQRCQRGSLDPALGSAQWSFIQVVRILWDAKGWQYGPWPRWIPDEITYRDTGLRFYLDQNCTRLRLGQGRVVVYDAGPFAWLVFGVLCLRLRFYLPNV